MSLEAKTGEEFLDIVQKEDVYLLRKFHNAILVGTNRGSRRIIGYLYLNHDHKLYSEV